MMKKVAAILAAMLVSAFATGTVFAAEFTPSVEGKDAPTVSVQTDEQGNEYVAVVKDAEGNVVQGVTADKLIVTPVSKKDEASADISTRLNEAYEQVQAATTLTDLTPEVGAVLMQMPTQVTVEEMVVRDLFDVSFDAETENYLAEGNQVTLNFEVAVAEGKPLIVMQYVNGEWKVIDPSKVIINADGTVSVTLDTAGTIAFATQKDAVEENADGVAYLFPSDDSGNAAYTVSTQASAQKENAFQWPYLVAAGAAVLVAAGAASALLMKKDN